MLLLFIIFSIASCAPVNEILNAADNDFENFDNYLPKVGDLPKFHYSTFGENVVGDEDIANLIEFESSHKENPETFGEMADFAKEESQRKISETTPPPKAGNNNTEETTTVGSDEVTTQILENQDQIDPVVLEDDVKEGNRTMRQEDLDNEVEGSGDSKEKESQESDEEEEPNMITGLISAFLGGLSRPDGSVDVEAITGLLGSLSTQNPDGSYDFNGLTELLMSFFGGGGEEGGGSDFGAFIGGLTGAFLKGIANPPGAKGVGVFVGNLLGGILPALSAPAPTEEGEPQKPQQPLDSGGFLSGLLSSLLGNVANLSGSSNDNSGGGGNKFSLFKAIFSTITSVFSSSSSTAH